MLNLFNRRLLFMTRDRLTAYAWKQGGMVGRPKRFDPDEKGIKNFKKWIRKDLLTPCHLLIDLIDEEFHPDTVPHVLGPDRTAMVARRATKAFGKSPFSLALFQDRESKKGRRDDRIVRAGLPNPEPLAQWIDPLVKAQVSLGGIHSLPLVSLALLRALKLVTPATLLVSQQSTSGLRFSFFKGKYLKISRMARVPDNDPEKYSDLLVRELEKTQQYLRSLRLLSNDVPLSIAILSSADHLEAARPRFRDSATQKFHLLTVTEVAKTIRIKRDITTPFSDSLFIQLLGLKPGRNHYATPKMRRFHLSRRLRTGLTVASLVVASGSLGVSGFMLYKASVLESRWQENQRLTQSLRMEYRQVIGHHLDVATDPGDIRKSVQLE
ncbi:MAG: hypothetical protein HQL53_13220, partial [Magnetococcales bacterium]|nr:hypothetical protein [Magnetococcales bacterium]